MLRLQIWIPGKARGFMRHRSAVLPSGKLRGYHAPEHVEAEARIALEARRDFKARGGAQLVTACELVIAVNVSRPQRLRLKRYRPCDPEPARGKPDIDNVAKLVMDALTRAEVWVDDTVVARLLATRTYLGLDANGEDVGRPGTHVWVYG